MTDGQSRLSREDGSIGSSLSVPVFFTEVGGLFATGPFYKYKPGKHQKEQ